MGASGEAATGAAATVAKVVAAMVMVRVATWEEAEAMAVWVAQGLVRAWRCP